MQFEIACTAIGIVFVHSMQSGSNKFRLKTFWLEVTCAAFCSALHTLISHAQSFDQQSELMTTGHITIERKTLPFMLES